MQWWEKAVIIAGLLGLLAVVTGVAGAIYDLSQISGY